MKGSGRLAAVVVALFVIAVIWVGFARYTTVGWREVCIPKRSDVELLIQRLFGVLRRS